MLWRITCRVDGGGYTQHNLMATRSPTCSPSSSSTKSRWDLGHNTHTKPKRTVQKWCKFFTFLTVTSSHAFLARWLQLEWDVSWRLQIFGILDIWLLVKVFDESLLCLALFTYNHCQVFALYCLLLVSSATCLLCLQRRLPSLAWQQVCRDQKRHQLLCCCGTCGSRSQHLVLFLISFPLDSCIIFTTLIYFIQSLGCPLSFEFDKSAC